MRRIVLYIISLIESGLPSSWQELEVLEDAIRCFGDDWRKTLSILHSFTHTTPEIVLGEERVCEYVSSSVDVCEVLRELFSQNTFLVLFNTATRNCNGCEIVTSGTDILFSQFVDPSSVRGDQVGVPVFRYTVKRSTLGRQGKRRNRFL